MFTQHSKQLLGAAVLAVTLMAAPLAASAEKADDGARFTMSPVEGGFVRLDKQSGAMSMCKKSDEGWACEPMNDSQADMRKELDKLKAANSDLKNEIRRMEEVFGLNGKAPDADSGGPGPQAGGPPAKPFKLPSEKDVDQAIDYLEGMIRKFRERFEDFGDKTDPNRPKPDQGPTQL